MPLSQISKARSENAGPQQHQEGNRKLALPQIPVTPQSDTRSLLGDPFLNSAARALSAVARALRRRLLDQRKSWVWQVNLDESSLRCSTNARRSAGMGRRQASHTRQLLLLVSWLADAEVSGRPAPQPSVPDFAPVSRACTKSLSARAAICLCQSPS